MVPPSTGGARAEVHQAAWVFGSWVVGFGTEAGCTSRFGLGGGSDYDDGTRDRWVGEEV